MKHLQKYSEFLNEKISNVNNLTDKILADIDKIWNKIARQKSKFIFKFKLSDYGIDFKGFEEVDDWTINFKKEKSKGTAGKIIIDDNEITIYNCIVEGEWDKIMIFATLTHELTHLSQALNKSLSYWDSKGLGSEEYTKGIIKHYEAPYEQEASQAEFYQQLKMGEIDLAIEFIKKYNKYFEMLDFKQFVKNGMIYGLSKEVITDVLKRLKSIIPDYPELVNLAYNKDDKNNFED